MKIKTIPGLPMTQEEIDAQLAFVSGVAEEAESITEENENDYLLPRDLGPRNSQGLFSQL